MTTIFLSYSRKDTEMMERVKQALLDAGIPVWVAFGSEEGPVELGVLTSGDSDTDRG